MTEILNFEARMFIIVYFQLRKKEFDWSTFFVGPIRDLFSQLKKKKINIRTSKFKILSNQQITGLHSKNKT